jgi:hypothetical protein
MPAEGEEMQHSPAMARNDEPMRIAYAQVEFAKVN